MRIIGRLGALILGLIGVVIGLAANFVGVVHGYATDVTHHGFVGILLLLIGLVGAFMAVLTPIVAAVLLLIAGVGFFYVLGWGALFVAPFFVTAAILAYIDRRAATAQ